MLLYDHNREHRVVGIVTAIDWGTPPQSPLRRVRANLDVSFQDHTKAGPLAWHAPTKILLLLITQPTNSWC